VSEARILVVEDDSGIATGLERALTAEQYAVDIARTGAEAVRLALHDPDAEPNLVLLDLGLPDRDGLDVCRRIIETRPSLPIIVLTARADELDIVVGLDAGAVDYVTKPFMPEELLARVNAHIGLKLTRDRLERVARERQELVNLVAHDLKNPLSSVLFASDVLRNNGCRPERVPRYLDMIHESAADAIGYIRRYLEMQEAHSGARKAAASVSLNAVAAWLVDRYELQLESRGMRLDVTAAQHDAAVAIDGLVLRQVAENLISNAMKYAPGSTVELSIRHGSPGFCQLWVEDRGPGIPAARQRELFKPFTRLSDAPADGVSSGLGLSLARQTIAGAGGQLWYEDREGGGARFVLELPVAREEVPETTC